MLSTIEHFRDRMLAITVRATLHLERKTADGIVELGECRREMAAVLLTYSQFVHREIFEPLAMCGAPAEMRAAKEIKVECICLVEEFRAYTSRWQFADVAAAWLEYRPEAFAFRLRIERHLERIAALSDPALSDSVRRAA